MTTNCIKFTNAHIETAKGVGSISTLTFDLDITVEPIASANPMARRDTLVAPSGETGAGTITEAAPSRDEPRRRCIA